jgi:predicted secreted acid phosphatase
MSGSIIETLIKDVTLEKYDNNKITMMTKPTSNKKYRILINLDQKFIKSEYINTELIMAIAHPECHKI